MQQTKAPSANYKLHIYKLRNYKLNWLQFDTNVEYLIAEYVH